MDSLIGFIWFVLLTLPVIFLAGIRVYVGRIYRIFLRSQKIQWQLYGPQIKQLDIPVHEREALINDYHSLGKAVSKYRG